MDLDMGDPVAFIRIEQRKFLYPLGRKKGKVT